MLKNYVVSFWKYYLSKKPKLMLMVILIIIVYVWINHIYGLQVERATGVSEIYLAKATAGIFVPYIKPLFVFLAGLVVINKI